MKLHLFYSTVCLALSLTQLVHASQLEIDSSHSSIGFEVKHLVFSTLHGNFTNFDGTIDFNEKDFTKSTINVTVKVDSITTANAKRDEHLKSPDFFDVNTFPAAKFVSTSIKKISKDQYKLSGDLSLHGITKTIEFTTHYLGKNKDPWGAVKYIFQATTELNRKDFGLKYNKTLEAGGVLIGEQVKLTVDIEASPKEK